MTRPTTKRRETRAEADERIVAEAGPWDVPYRQSGSGTAVTLGWRGTYPHELAKNRAICYAAARILNRIARKRSPR